MKNYLIVLISIVAMVDGYSQNNKNMLETATFAGGCFWCTEAIFEQLEGVENVESGYSGGKFKNPTYKEISTGKTGYAEVIKIEYNPLKISYIELLDIFFYTHNPTTLNQQGYDKGTQYRSAIFYHNETQKMEAEAMIEALTNAAIYDDPIVTEVTIFTTYFKAEEHHQNYYENNKYQGYCMAVINPKLKKFQAKYKAKLKQK